MGGEEPQPGESTARGRWRCLPGNSRWRNREDGGLFLGGRGVFWGVIIGTCLGVLIAKGLTYLGKCSGTGGEG